jgi:hypothetical protein
MLKVPGLLLVGVVEIVGLKPAGIIEVVVVQLVQRHAVKMRDSYV